MLKPMLASLLLAFVLHSTIPASAVADEKAPDKSDAAPAETEEAPMRLELSALTNSVLFINSDGLFGFAAAGASYAIAPGLQLSATLVSADLAVFDGSNSALHGRTTNFLGMLVGPVLNFPFKLDVRDSFFVSAKYGFGATWTTSNSSSTSSSSDTSASKGVLDFTLGKRFKLLERLAYTPEIGLSKVLNFDASSVVFRVVPFGFSLFL